MSRVRYIPIPLLYKWEFKHLKNFFFLFCYFFLFSPSFLCNFFFLLLAYFFFFLFIYFSSPNLLTEDRFFVLCVCVLITQLASYSTHTFNIIAIQKRDMA